MKKLIVVLAMVMMMACSENTVSSSTLGNNISDIKETCEVTSDTLNSFTECDDGTWLVNIITSMKPYETVDSVDHYSIGRFYKYTLIGTTVKTIDGSSLPSYLGVNAVYVSIQYDYNDEMWVITDEINSIYADGLDELLNVTENSYGIATLNLIDSDFTVLGISSDLLVDYE